VCAARIWHEAETSSVHIASPALVAVSTLGCVCLGQRRLGQVEVYDTVCSVPAVGVNFWPNFSPYLGRVMLGVHENLTSLSRAVERWVLLVSRLTMGALVGRVQ